MLIDGYEQYHVRHIPHSGHHLEYTLEIGKIGQGVGSGAGGD